MRNKTDLEDRGLLPSQKTTSVLIIVIPIVTLFLLVYTVDFCRYRRKKTMSRQHRFEAGQKLRVRAQVLTNTFVTEETKPWGKSRKRSSLLSHVKHHRSDKNSAEKSLKQSIFSLNIPGVFSTATAMAYHHDGVTNHMISDDSHVTVADKVEQSPVNVKEKRKNLEEINAKELLSRNPDVSQTRNPDELTPC